MPAGRRRRLPAPFRLRRSKCGTGNWIPWLERIRIPIRMAQRAMALCDRYPEMRQLSFFDFLLDAIVGPDAAGFERPRGQNAVPPAASVAARVLGSPKPGVAVARAGSGRQGPHP